MPYTHTWMPTIGWPLDNPEVSITTWDNKEVSGASYNIVSSGIEITVNTSNRYYLTVRSGSLSERKLVDIPARQRSTSLETRIQELVESSPSLTASSTEGFFDLQGVETPYQPIGADPNTGSLPPTVVTGLESKFAKSSDVVFTVGGVAPDDSGNVPLSGGGSFELRDTGMPNGVVTADPGTYYTDTNGTNGAWRWLKQSGTGNTGWIVVTGDTGWRSVTVDPTYAGSSGTPLISGSWVLFKRVDNTIFLHLSYNQNSAAGVVTAIPQGFGGISDSTAAQHGMTYPTYRRSTTASSAIYVGWGVRTISTISTGQIDQRCLVSWPTGDSWPTTLPGNAV